MIGTFRKNVRWKSLWLAAAAAVVIGWCAPAKAATYNFTTGTYTIQFTAAAGPNDLLYFQHSVEPGPDNSTYNPNTVWFTSWSGFYSIAALRADGTLVAVINDHSQFSYTLFPNGNSSHPPSSFFNYSRPLGQPNDPFPLIITGATKLEIEVSAGGVNYAPNIPFVLTVITPDGIETPIPGALPLFTTGLGALGLITYRRKRKQAA